MEVRRLIWPARLTWILGSMASAGSMPERSFWVATPGQGEIRTLPDTAPSIGDVAVVARTSAISRGTEALVFQGRVPPSLFVDMRCPFQAGDFPAPVKFGYASVGTADKIGRVFCLHPHQDRYNVPADRLIPVPDNVPDRRAVLAANMETTVNALWDAGPRVGDRIAVVGAGVVGCLFAAMVARIPGTQVELIDINSARAATAHALGVKFATPDGATAGVDIVVHASGSPEGFATCLLYTSPSPRD